MQVAAVVIHYGSPDDTRECVDSLLRATYSPLRILVVDNAAPRPFEDVRVEVWRSPANLGFAGGFNAGCRRAFESGAAYAIVLNNDLTVDAGFVEPLVDALRQDAQLGAVGPKIHMYETPELLYGCGARVDRFLGRSTMVGVLERDRGQFDGLRHMGWLSGCAMMVARETFARVGPMDERFFLYWEDLDWCLRAREAGYRLAAVPASRIRHRGHRSTGREGIGRVRYYMTRNQLEILRKHRRFFVLNGAPATAFFAAWAAKNVLANLARGDAKGREVARGTVRGIRDFYVGTMGAGTR